MNNEINIVSILKTLGWPLGLVTVLGAVLALFGVSLDQVLVIAGSLVGLWAVFALVVNILKVVGVVDPGTAGKWSAALNLLGVIGIAFVLASNPTFDFLSLDAKLKIIAEFGSMILVLVVNMLGTQAMHNMMVKNFGIRAFTFQPQSRAF